MDIFNPFFLHFSFWLGYEEERTFGVTDGFDWGSLDGLRLEFKNGNRPDLSYLYMQLLATLMRRRRFKCTG